MTENKSTRFVTVEDAAKQLGVPKTWLDRMIEGRELSCIKTSNRTLVSVDQLESELRQYAQDNR